MTVKPRSAKSDAMPVQSKCPGCGIPRAWMDNWAADENDPNNCVSISLEGLLNRCNADCFLLNAAGGKLIRFHKQFPAVCESLLSIQRTDTIFILGPCLDFLGGATDVHFLFN